MRVPEIEGKFLINFSMGGKNWFEISGVSNRGFEKSGVKLQCLTEANPREARHGSINWEVQKEIEGSKNQDSTVQVSVCL